MSARPSDLYAFVSPDAPDTATIIATYTPSPEEAGEPEFAGDVLYEIHIDVNGDARPDLTYQFRFRTELRDDRTLLYQTGPIESVDSENWNRRQFYSVTAVDAYGKHSVLADHLPCPPWNVGGEIPDHERLAAAAVATLPGAEKVFAGQRAGAFFVDPGAIFELGARGPFGAAAAGLEGPAGLDGASGADRPNVHSIALQVPLRLVEGDVLGVWTSASRRAVRVSSDDVVVGPHEQVARLGNPLFGEVIVPAAERDTWNALPPAEDKRFAAFVEKPEFAGRLPELYPGQFARLGDLTRAGTPRADLVAMLLTGIPDGLIDYFANGTGETQADMLRLATAVPPSDDPNPFGLLGGDLAGFPNGRRIADDVVSIVLRSIAGATFGLVDDTFRPDDAAALAERGPVTEDGHLLATFPYLGTPRV
jgi:hypothetical protein